MAAPAHAPARASAQPWSLTASPALINQATRLDKLLRQAAETAGRYAAENAEWQARGSTAPASSVKPRRIRSSPYKHRPWTKWRWRSKSGKAAVASGGLTTM